MVNEITTPRGTEAVFPPEITWPESSRRTEIKDSDVAELCQQNLSRSPYLALRYLDCHVYEGILTLSGTVPTYHTKQMAYVALRDVPGVKSIVDHIEVPGRVSKETRKEQV